MERHLGLVQVRKMSGKEGRKLGYKQSILGCLKVGGQGAERGSTQRLEWVHVGGAWPSPPSWVSGVDRKRGWLRGRPAANKVRI